MSELWNNWEVNPPPICTVKMVLYVKEMNEVKEILFDASKTLSNIQYLHREAAILGRFLYKNRRTFRHDKGTQNLVKIHQCLKKYFKLNLLETITTYTQSFPNKFRPGTSHAYLPTRQMLKWVLMRLQAFSQLFKRLIELCKETGTHVYKKLFLGWSLNFHFFIFSITARILSCSKFLVLKSIEWYNTLYKYLPYFESTLPYLPKYELPSNLKTWLGDVDIYQRRSKTSIDKLFETIDLVRDDEGGDDNEISVLNENLVKSWFKVVTVGDQANVEVEEIVEEEREEKIPRKRGHPVVQDEDLGVPVESDGTSDVPGKKFKKNNKGDKNERRHYFHRYKYNKYTRNLP